MPSHSKASARMGTSHWRIYVPFPQSKHTPYFPDTEKLSHEKYGRFLKLAAAHFSTLVDQYLPGGCHQVGGMKKLVDQC